MTLKEFDAIRSYLPKNINIIIEFPNIAPSNKGHLVKETWGNHDGRYNMKCTECGWQSSDIHPGGIEPTECPICSFNLKEKEKR